MGSPVWRFSSFEVGGLREGRRAHGAPGSDAAVRHFEASAREMDQPTAKQATANARDRHKSAGGVATGTSS